MPLCSPLKYLHRKHFVVVYPFGRATDILSLTVSEKTSSTCFSFKSSYFLPLPVNNSPLIHCGMSSTSCLVVKWMLRTATYHMTDWATVSSVAGQQLYTRLTRPFPLHVEVRWLVGLNEAATSCNRAIRKAPH